MQTLHLPGGRKLSLFLTREWWKIAALLWAAWAAWGRGAGKCGFGGWQPNTCGSGSLAHNSGYLLSALYWLLGGGGTEQGQAVLHNLCRQRCSWRMVKALCGWAESWRSACAPLWKESNQEYNWTPPQSGRGVFITVSSYIHFVWILLQYSKPSPLASVAKIHYHISGESNPSQRTV